MKNLGIKNKIMVALGLIVMVVMLTGCYDTTSSTTNIDNEVITDTETKTETESSEPEYVFTEKPRLVKEEYSTYIVGVLKNNSGSEKDYLQVTFTLYDSDGNNIGTAWTNVNDLKAGGTWKFEAYSFEDDVASFELDEVSGW